MKKRRPLGRRGDRHATPPPRTGDDTGTVLLVPTRSQPDTTPYDDGLLDRARNHWRLGEWQPLTELPMDQIEPHPERARLLLMVAAAHQALGQAAQTRQLVRLARPWGCDQQLLVRVLLAGVHNTLGRAAAAGGRLRDQALAHFRDALQPGAGGARRGAVLARAQQEMAQMNLPGQAQQWLLGPESARALPLGHTGTALRTADALAEAQLARMDKLGKTMEKTIQLEVANAVRQLEAFSNLQGYLTSGEILPALHGWPVSPDFALLVVQLLEQQHFDAVVEFGSGSSTLLIARTLDKVARKRPDARATVQMAFEHLEKYHQGTADLLAGHALQDRVDLVLAPLQPVVMHAGDTFNYYDTPAALQRLAQRLAEVPAPRVLAVVDGPPEATGPLARYPALEVLLRALPRLRGQLLLDDYRRQGEKDTAKRWLEFLESRGIAATVTEFPLEKAACLIQFDASAANLADSAPGRAPS